MALPIRDQLKYWGIAAAVFMVALWFMGDVLLPFLLGGAIAYFLDPVADRLERLGLSRVMATALITVAALLIFVLMALLVIPTLVNQTVNLIETAPKVTRNFTDFITDRFPSLLDDDSTLRTSLTTLGTTIQERGGELFQTALASFASLINILLLFVIVPVVAVYLLLDWDRMVAAIDRLLPRDHAPTIRHWRGDRCDTRLLRTRHGHGLPDPWHLLRRGADAGGAAVRPRRRFRGRFGYFHPLPRRIDRWGAGDRAGAVPILGRLGVDRAGRGIFVLGQIVEGNLLTPKLVGNSVGLHPVWLLLALSVFGTLFGFVGLLVAVPVAAAIGVIARFATARYRESVLYMGREPETTVDEDIR